MKKNGEKAASVIMTALFLVSSFSMYSFAEEAEGETGGICSDCGGPVTEDGFCTAHPDQGLGLEAAQLTTDNVLNISSYEIDNAGQLLWFARGYQEGTLESANAFLSSDINWSGIAQAGAVWIPIGSPADDGTENSYSGIFNGNGYEIQNLLLEDSGDPNLAVVFSSIGTGGIVDSLGINGASTASSASNVSVLAGVNRGSIRNCYIKQSEITVNTGWAAVSGIAAVNAGSIGNCFEELNVQAGTAADGAAGAFRVFPVCAENQADPSMISACFYLPQDGTDIQLPVGVSENGITAATAEAFADGSIAYGLNEGQGSMAWEQDLTGAAQFPSLVKRMSGIVSYPVYCVTLDYIEQEDVKLYTNGIVALERLPQDGVIWQLEQDGTAADVTADFTIGADTVLTEKAEPQKAAASLSITPNVIKENGKPVDISCFTITGNEGGAAVTLTFYSAENTDTPIEAPSSAGNYYAAASVEETENYTAAQTELVPFTIEACEHTAGTYEEVVTPASCTEDGKKEIRCSICHALLSEEAVPEAGHRWGEYIYNNDASCQKDGTKTAVCDYGCGTKDTVTAEGTKTGHSFTNYVYNKDASCSNDGTKTAVCDYGCGAKDTITAPGTKLAHTYGENGICTVCQAVDPNYTVTTAAPEANDAVREAGNQPILGIEDFSGIWGIVLICAGVVIIVLIAVMVAVRRRK